MSHLTHGIIFELTGLSVDAMDNDPLDKLGESIRQRCENLLEEYINNTFDYYEVKRIIFGKTEKEDFIKNYTYLIDGTMTNLNFHLDSILKTALDIGIGDGENLLINKNNISKLICRKNQPIAEHLNKLGKIIDGDYISETLLYYDEYGGSAANESYIHDVYYNSQNYVLVLVDIHC